LFGIAFPNEFPIPTTLDMPQLQASFISAERSHRPGLNVLQAA